MAETRRIVCESKLSSTCDINTLLSKNKLLFWLMSKIIGIVKTNATGDTKREYKFPSFGRIKR